MTQYIKIHNVFPAEHSLFMVQSITPNRSHMHKAINLITINGKSTSGMVQQILYLLTANVLLLKFSCFVIITLKLAVVGKL